MSFKKFDGVIKSKTGGFKFYDKVARKFGSYSDHGYEKTKKCPKGDPEKIFIEKLIEISGENKVALDVGCADGTFSLEMAPYFKKVIAIDLSQKMLEVGIKWQKMKKIKNVSFERVDAYETKYKDSSFDVAYSRRGPSKFSEIFRILKKGGYFIEIGIGEKDAQGIKEIFGRGQDFGDWKNSRLKKIEAELEKIGFHVVFAKEYFYEEYYKTRKDLELFLESVPIFEDFDVRRDKKFLDKYEKLSGTREGIKLPRHRIVTVSCK